MSLSILTGAVACNCFERGLTTPADPAWNLVAKETGQLSCHNAEHQAAFLEWRSKACACKNGQLASEVMRGSYVLEKIRDELQKHPTVFPNVLKVFLAHPITEGTVISWSSVASCEWRELELLDFVSSGSGYLDSAIHAFKKDIRKLIVMSRVAQKPIYFYCEEQSGPGAKFWPFLRDATDRFSIGDSHGDFLKIFADTEVVGRNLFVASCCEVQVDNGGFLQYFRNSYGLFAPEAAAAFDAIGLHEWAGIVRTGMEFFGLEYPRDRLLRLAKLLGYNSSSSPFKECDHRFGTVKEGIPSFLHVAADAYVEANTDVGKESPQGTPA